jgi:hypothetical protein
MSGGRGPRATATVFCTPVTIQNISGRVVPNQPACPVLDHQPGRQQIGSGPVVGTGVGTLSLVQGTEVV